MSNNRVFSFGGGVQSTAALVLAAQGKIPYRKFVFCNVGDDSESPDTLQYVREVSIPYAEANGLELVEIARITRGGEVAETLLERTRRETRSIKIPVHMNPGGPGRRSCTYDYKIGVLRRYLGKGDWVVGLGISMDESHRMRDSGHKRFTNEYPLIGARIFRQDCHNIIAAAGLPVAPKSACWFCPFHSIPAWQNMRAEKPELFNEAVKLEQELIEKRRAMGRDDVYLTGRGKTLDKAIADQPKLMEDDNCDGYCFT